MSYMSELHQDQQEQQQLDDQRQMQDEHLHQQWIADVEMQAEYQKWLKDVERLPLIVVTGE